MRLRSAHTGAEDGGVAYEEDGLAVCFIVAEEAVPASVCRVRRDRESERRRFE
jgi:hypothetical protein